MIITIDILKKINGSIASNTFYTIRELARECYMDEKVLEVVTGDLGREVSSMGNFLEMVELYIVEMQKRVRILNECYHAIQKLQVDNGIIDKTGEIPDPPIIW